MAELTKGYRAVVTGEIFRCGAAGFSSETTGRNSKLRPEREKKQIINVAKVRRSKAMRSVAKTMITRCIQHVTCGTRRK